METETETTEGVQVESDSRSGNRIANAIADLDKIDSAPEEKAEAPAPDEPEAKAKAETPAPDEPEAKAKAEAPEKPDEDVPDRTWQNVLKIDKEIRELRKENESFKKRDKEYSDFKAKEKDFAEVQEFIRKVKENPVELLDQWMGEDVLRQWQEHATARKVPARPVRDLETEKRLAAIEQEREQERQTARQREEQQALTQYISQVENIAQGDDYKLFQRKDGKNVALRIVAEHFESTGEILDPKVAARLAKDEIQKAYEDEMAFYESVKKKKEPAPKKVEAKEDDVDEVKSEKPNKRYPKQDRIKRAMAALGEY